MKKKICPCGEKSIPGLIKSVSLCQKHYNYVMFETDTIKHNEGVRMMEYSKQGASIAPNKMTLQKGDQK